jgi:hypothetical protein
MTAVNVNELTHVHTCPTCQREQECDTMYCRGLTQKCCWRCVWSDNTTPRT